MPRRLGTATDASPDYIRSLLDYDSVRGRLVWRGVGHAARRPGHIAGSAHKSGYRHITIDRRAYKEHRVVWCWVHGRWPPDEIDHINRDRSDNRVENLREATRSQNAINGPVRRNNATGHNGVSRRHGRWLARIHIGYKSRFLGYFDSLDDAIAARAIAAQAVLPS